MKYYYSNFSHNVRFLRLAYGLTQKEMAQIIGVSVSTLRRIEKQVPTVRTNAEMLRRLCDHFYLSADAVLLKRFE